MHIDAYVSIASYINNAPGSVALEIHLHRKKNHETILSLDRTNAATLARMAYIHIKNHTKETPCLIRFHTYDELFAEIVQNENKHLVEIYHPGENSILEHIYQKAFNCSESE